MSTHNKAVIMLTVTLAIMLVTVYYTVKLDHMVDNSECPTGTQIIMARNGTFCVATVPLIEKK